MPKTMIAMRASAETIRKIEELVKMWGAGTTKSEVIAIAVDRLYEQEIARHRKDASDGLAQH